MNLDTTNIAKRLFERGNDWSDKKAAADLLGETKKVLLAELATESDESSVAAKEAYALRHPKYREHLEQMVEAERLANRAKVRYLAEQTRIDLLRTNAANERAANQHQP